MAYISTQFKKLTGGKAKPSLKDTLQDKANLLTIEADSHESVAKHMVQAALEERMQGNVKVKQAKALEQAHAILHEAGVTL